MLHHFSYTERNLPQINGNRSAPDFTHVYIGESDGRPVLQRFLPQLEGMADKYQFARKGMSTTDALINFLQPIFEATDKGDNI